MAVRRSAAVVQSTEQQSNELKLMERLVQKSLMVNPGLAAGKDFGQAYAELRHQVAPKPQEDEPADSPHSKAERRTSMARFFVREKEEDLDAALLDIEAQEKALAEKKELIKRIALGDTVEFLALLGGREPSGLPKMVEEHRQFWARLGITEREALERVKKAL